MDKYIKLRDGRTLAWREYGDPKGFPVIYAHGWPACRLSGQMLHKAAKYFGIRVISPDRTGYGMSDDKENRSISDWTIDIQELLHHLRIFRCGVLGSSGGAPYALCLAASFPTVVSRCVVSAGLGEMASPDICKRSLKYQIAVWSIKRFPYCIVLPIYIVRMLIFHAPRFYLHLVHPKNGSADGKIAHGDTFISYFVQSTRMSLRQGIHSSIRDWQLYFSPWGFCIEDIRVPVSFFHGNDDRQIPVWIARCMAARIKQSTLHIFENTGHYIFSKHPQEQYLYRILHLFTRSFEREKLK
jgi:pimeloyl-ACP methyl ester carboxylesterase